MLENKLDNSFVFKKLARVGMTDPANSQITN